MKKHPKNGFKEVLWKNSSETVQKEPDPMNQTTVWDDAALAPVGYAESERTEHSPAT